MIRAIVVLILIAAAVKVALSHTDGPGSWINNQTIRDPVTHEHCCNLHDCAEEFGIRAVERGYYIPTTGEIFPQHRVIWKSPGGWWRCRYNNGGTRCLIGPPPSG